MKNKKTTIYIIMSLFGVIIISLGAFICYNAHHFGVPYSKSIPILSILVLGLLSYLKISQLDWYKELTDRGYLKFRELFFSYKVKVIEQKQRYDIFVFEYCNSNVMLSTKADNVGNVIPADYNAKNNINQQIKYILENRSDLVEKYFHQDVFAYEDYTSLINDYKSTLSPSEVSNQIVLENPSFKFYNLDDEKIEKELQEFVLESYKGGKMHLADRNFGYFLMHRHPAYVLSTQYIRAWDKYIGEYEPRDNCRYISDPAYWKSPTEIDTTLKALRQILNFYLAFMVVEAPIIKAIQKDIERLSELNEKKS